jgi:hypothetical protein
VLGGGNIFGSGREGRKERGGKGKGKGYISTDPNFREDIMQQMQNDAMVPVHAIYPVDVKI